MLSMCGFICSRFWLNTQIPGQTDHMNCHVVPCLQLSTTGGPHSSRPTPAWPFIAQIQYVMKQWNPNYYSIKWTLRKYLVILQHHSYKINLNTGNILFDMHTVNTWINARASIYFRDVFHPPSVYSSRTSIFDYDKTPLSLPWRWDAQFE